MNCMHRALKPGQSSSLTQAGARLSPQPIWYDSLMSGVPVEGLREVEMHAASLQL